VAGSEQRVEGSAVAYRERLHAPWWLWALGTLLMATLGVAYGFRLGPLVGIATFVVAESLLAALLLATAPLVVVDGSVLRAGRARLPLQHIARVATLDAERTRDARGTGADRRAYLCMRGWIPSSVLVEVDDPDDPHPYWLVSTRRGRELAPVLAAARDSARDVAG
jgi:hypothetical protein